MDHFNYCKVYSSVALSIFRMSCNHHVSEFFHRPTRKPHAPPAPPPALPAPSAFCLWMCLLWAFHLKGTLPSVACDWLRSLIPF